MTVYDSYLSPAVERCRRALDELDAAHGTPRERLAAALHALNPVITNTTGLTAQERERFFGLVHRVSAYLDMEESDLAKGLFAAPSGWIDETTRHTRELVAAVLARIDAGS